MYMGERGRGRERERARASVRSGFGYVCFLNIFIYRYLFKINLILGSQGNVRTKGKREYLAERKIH